MQNFLKYVVCLSVGRFCGVCRALPVPKKNLAADIAAVQRALAKNQKLGNKKEESGSEYQEGDEDGSSEESSEDESVDQEQEDSKPRAKEKGKPEKYEESLLKKAKDQRGGEEDTGEKCFLDSEGKKIMTYKMYERLTANSTGRTLVDLDILCCT